MFFPALLFLELGGFFVLFRRKRNYLERAKSFISYCSSAFITGALHFFSGAMMKTVTWGLRGRGGRAENTSIFVDPGSYSLLEKVAGHLAYTHLTSGLLSSVSTGRDSSRMF